MREFLREAIGVVIGFIVFVWMMGAAFQAVQPKWSDWWELPFAFTNLVLSGFLGVVVAILIRKLLFRIL